MQTLMKCSIMLHFIWVFTVCQRTHLGVWRIQKVNSLQKPSAVLLTWMCGWLVKVHQKPFILYCKQYFKSKMWCENKLQLPPIDLRCQKCQYFDKAVIDVCTLTIWTLKFWKIGMSISASEEIRSLYDSELLFCPTARTSLIWNYFCSHMYLF